MKAEPSANPRRRRKRRSRTTLKIGRRRIPIWVIVALVITTGAGFLAKPAYRAYRKHRIEMNFQAAQAAARTGDWGAARDKARSVLLARPGDFAAYCLWVRAIGRLEEPAAGMAAVQLASDKRTPREDRLECIRVLARQGPHAVVFTVYSHLPPELRKDAAFVAALTPLLVTRGDIDNAEKALRKVLENTASAKVRLELLRVLCARPTPARVAEARGILASLIATKADTEAMAALILLGEASGGLAAGDPLPDLRAWLKTQPTATAKHHLLALEPTTPDQTQAADAMYAAAITRFLPDDPATLGAWLAKHGRASQAATILEAPARSRPEAFLARLRILLDLHEEAQVEASLASPPPATDPIEIEFMQAELAWLRSNSTAAEAAITRAMNHAASDTHHNRFIDIAWFATRHRAVAASQDAWLAALLMGWGPLPIYLDLVPVLNSLAVAGRTEDLLAMYQTLSWFEPNDHGLLNNYHYLALIHGTLPPAQVVTKLLQLVAVNPDRSEFHSTLMMAEILDNRAADALTRLPQFRNSPRINPQITVALEGSARLMLGETAAATSLLDKVDWSTLMPQERVVFRALLQKLKFSGTPLPEPGSATPAPTPAWRTALARGGKEHAEAARPADPAPSMNAPTPPEPTADSP